MTTTVHFLYEVSKHALGGVEVRDHTVLERPNSHNIAGGPTDHLLGFGTNGQNSTGRVVDGDHGRLVQDDSPPADVDQGVGRAEVHSHIATDKGRTGGETHAGTSNRSGKGHDIPRARMPEGC